MSDTDATALAKEWIAAFNDHDLPRIMAHYAETIELTSPVFQLFTEGREDTARGKAELERYFSYGLRMFPGLTFTPERLYLGVGSFCLCYHTTVRDRMVCEYMAYDDCGKINRVTALYQAPY